MRSGRGSLWMVVVTLAVASCTGAPADPERVDTCEGLVPVGAELVEDYLAVLTGLPIEVVAGEQAPPPELAALTERGAELDRRAARLGCDEKELNRGIAAAVADLRTDDDVGALFLEIVRTGVIGSLPVLPPESTTVP